MLSLIASLVLIALGHPLAIMLSAAYLTAIAGLAVTASRLSLKSRIALLIVLPTMHLSWGWGFILGFLRGATKTVDRSRAGTRSAS